MIRFEKVGVRYTGSDAPVLSGVDLHVPEGELVLVVGRTGSGKSTLLRAVNGLVPHFTGGLLSGRVTVAGRDTREHRPRRTIRPASWPDWSALSVRTPCPASSPTRSRRSSPTAWSPSASRPR